MIPILMTHLQLTAILTNSHSRQEYQESPELAGELLAVGISLRDDTLDAIEHAAWTATARAVLNLRETIGRY